MRIRIAAILSAVLGIVACPVCALLFPLAQRMSAYRMPDGSRAVLSPTTGTWIFPLGLVMAISFIGLAVILFALSNRQQR